MPIAAILRSGPLLVGLDPDAGASLDPLGVDAVVGHDGDHDGLEPLHVVTDARPVLQLEDGVGDQLAGAVPGQLAAAVHGHDGRSVKRPFVVFGELAGGIDGGMFEEQYCAGRLAGDDFVVEFALDVPAARVINEVRGETHLCELKSHGIKLRPRRTQHPFVCLSSHACG